MASEQKKILSKDTQIELRFLESIRDRCPQNVGVLKALGDLYTRAGKVRQGLGIDLELTRLCPEESEVWYNLGCSYALTGGSDKAFEALERAIALGYRDFEWMREDEDLNTLHGDPRFQKLLSEAGVE